MNKAGKAKDEVEMYAITVSTDEVYEKLIIQHDPEVEEALREHAKMIHPDPLGRFQAFLYFTPKERAEAYKHLKEVFSSAAIMAQVGYVPREDLEKAGVKHEKQ